MRVGEGRAPGDGGGGRGRKNRDSSALPVTQAAPTGAARFHARPVSANLSSISGASAGAEAITFRPRLPRVHRVRSPSSLLLLGSCFSGSSRLLAESFLEGSCLGDENRGEPFVASSSLQRRHPLGDFLVGAHEEALSSLLSGPLGLASFPRNDLFVDASPCLVGGEESPSGPRVYPFVLLLRSIAVTAACCRSPPLHTPVSMFASSNRTFGCIAVITRSSSSHHARGLG